MIALVFLGYQFDGASLIAGIFAGVFGLAAIVACLIFVSVVWNELSDRCDENEGAAWGDPGPVFGKTSNKENHHE